MDAGTPGYDVMSAPGAECRAVGRQLLDPRRTGAGHRPGVGGIDESLGRLLTITQDKGTTCVFD